MQDEERVVAAGIFSAACDHCGLSKSELLVRVGLDGQRLADPDAPVRASALMELIRYGDPALGIELACLRRFRLPPLLAASRTMSM